MKTVCFSFILLLGSLLTLANIPETHNALGVSIPPIRQVEFAKDRYVWVLMIDGKVQFTRDGGKTWQLAKLEPSTEFIRIDFVDEMRGWAIDNKGQVQATTDGGENWTVLNKLRETKKTGPYFNDIRFSDYNNGWLIEYHKTIWKTSDGGRSWTEVAHPEVRELGRIYLANNLILISWQNGFIYTKDKGVSWEKMLVHSTYAWIVDAFFVDEKTGWATGFPNMGAYKTTDGGKKWRPIPVTRARPSEEIISSIFFTNKNEGWAVGPNQRVGPPYLTGSVRHSINGGKTWKEVPVKGNDSIFTRVYFSSSKVGWLVDSCSIYRTENRGKTWTIVLRLPPIKEGNDVIIR